jgi:hypothetical protein
LAPAAARRAAAAHLNVVDGDDLVRALAARRRDLDGIAGLL